MTTQLAAVKFLDGRRPSGPVHRSIIAVDLEGSTRRTNPVKGELRRVIYELLAHALESVAITGNRLERLVDRGDGVLMLIRPHDDVPKTILLDRLIPLLASLLAEYNARAAQPALRIRLRAVVHAGEVHDDGRGFYGEAIDVAIRLLDSPTVKKTLKLTAGPVPVPVRLTTCGLPTATSVMVTPPSDVLGVVGVNVTLTLQLEPAAREVPQVLDSE